MSQIEGHFKRRLAARLNEIGGDNMICQVDDLQAECQRSLSGDFNVSYPAGRLLNVFDVQFQGPAGSVPVKSGSSDDFARCVYLFQRCRRSVPVMLPRILPAGRGPALLSRLPQTTRPPKWSTPSAPMIVKV